MKTNGEENRYKEIIGLPHHTSKTRRRMSSQERAAQFAPFAALTGFGEEITEEARLTGRRIELDDYEIEMLNNKLSMILSDGALREVGITYFVKDARKDGGKYLKIKDKIKRVDELLGIVVTERGGSIPLSDIIAIDDL